MPLGPTQKQKMALTAEMMIKGATLLGEACPRCGAVQIRFQGHTYCTVEDDLGRALSPEGAKPHGELSKRTETENVAPKVEASSARIALKEILEQKLAAASKELETTSRVEEQSALLDLISKYVETLDRLKKLTPQG